MVKKLYLILVIFVFCFNFCFAQNQKFDIPNADTINSLFFPRDDGSEKEQKLIEFLQDFAKTRNLQCIVDPIISDEYISLSKNVIIDCGNTKSNNNLVFLSPLNSLLLNNTHIDNSLSIHIMLKMIDEIYSKNSDIHFIFAFVGASGCSDQPQYGVKHFIDNFDVYFKNSQDFSKSFFTNINIVTNQTPIFFLNNGSTFAIPENIMKMFIANKNDLISTKNFLQNKQNNFFEINTFKKQVFIDKNIKSVIFTNNFNFNSQYNNANEEQLSDFFVKWIFELSKLHLPIEQSDNYIMLPFFKHIYFISETTIFVVLLIMIFALLASRLYIPNLRRTRISLLFTIFFRFFIVLFAYYLLSFIPYFISHYIGLIFQNFSIHTNISFIYSLAIFFFTGFIFLLIKYFLPLNTMVNHSYLYVFVAIIFLFADIFFASIFDILLAFIFIFAMIMLTLSNLTGRNYILKYILYFLSVIPLILFFIFFIPNYVFIYSHHPNRFLNSVFFYNAVITISSFPFLMIFMRIDTIINRKIKFINQKLIYILMSFLSIFIFSIICFSVGNQTNRNTNLAKIDLITNVKAKKTELFVRSSKKGENDFFIDDSKQYFPLKVNKFYTQNIAFQNPPYSITTNTKKENNFNRYNINIQSKQLIKKINCYICIPKGYYPFDCNYKAKQISKPEYEKQNYQVYHFLLPRNIQNTTIEFVTINSIAISSFLEIEYYENQNIKTSFIDSNIITKTSFLYKDEFDF